MVKLGIVVSEFNTDITQEMLRHALKRCEEINVQVTYICRVPGAFDMPLFIAALLGREDVDAVVTLGAIVKGETKHDEVIAHALAQTIVGLSLKYGKPVTLGVSGPSMSWDQGAARAEEYARRGVDAAVKMVSRYQQLVRSFSEENRKYPVVIG
jgi:6,7-dimethyl-8-ribityllumazine synthase